MEVPTEPGYALAVIATKALVGGQQRHRPSRSFSIQFLWVGGVKVLVQDRIQQQRTWSRTSTFQLAEVFKVSPQARVHCFLIESIS